MSDKNQELEGFTGLNEKEYEEFSEVISKIFRDMYGNFNSCVWSEVGQCYIDLNTGQKVNKDGTPWELEEKKVLNKEGWRE